MDFSWPHVPAHSVNGAAPKDTFLGRPKKMHLLSAQDLACLIKGGGGAYLYSSDITHVYRKLPLDPTDCPLVCFKVEGRFYTDISLPFGLRWAASHCQVVSGLVARMLGRQVLSLLNYIDDFCSLAGMEAEAAQHFSVWTLLTTFHFLSCVTSTRLTTIFTCTVCFN